jgi:S1-C subfamily serine protease
MLIKLILFVVTLATGLVAHTGATPTTTSSGDTINTTTTTGAQSGNSAATLEQSVESAVQHAQPTVVEITAQGNGGTEQGSGTIITSSGYILTNNHVVQNGSSFQVTTTTGNFTATLKGTDATDDLAVLKITSTKSLPTITFADSSKAQVGEFVVAMGNPLGLGQSASFGIVSALNRPVDEGQNGASLTGMIQTSAPINPGNSGGALIDLTGNLVGIPTAGALDPEFGNTPADGVGFAIPANHANTIANQIIKSGSVTPPSGGTTTGGHAYLGVYVEDVMPGMGTAINHGVIIDRLVSGGAAANAGLHVSDIIYQIDTTTINTGQDLGTFLGTKSAGNKVTVDINRNGSNMKITVTLGSRG